MDTPPVELGMQCMEPRVRQPDDPISNLGLGKAALVEAFVYHHDSPTLPEQDLHTVVSVVERFGTAACIALILERRVHAPLRGHFPA